MSLVIKDSAAADVTFAPTGYSGTTMTFSDVAATATVKKTGDVKMTLNGKERRRLLSFQVRRYDAATGKWGFVRANLTIVSDDTGIATDVDARDVVAFASNYFTKNVAALSAATNLEIGKFLNGVAPF